MRAKYVNHHGKLAKNKITKAFSLDRKVLHTVKSQTLRKRHTIRFNAQSTKPGNYNVVKNN